jgi:hypothetical protein
MVVVRLIGTRRQHIHSWGELCRTAMGELGDGMLRRLRSTARVGEQVRRERLGLTSSTQEHGHVEGHAAEDGTGGRVSSMVGARAAHDGHIDVSSNRWRVPG